MSFETQVFSEVLDSLKVDNIDEIHGRRDEITKALNKEFRGNDSTKHHRYYIGSFGRYTAIRGVSDLDLMYILPPSLKKEYLNSGGALKSLNRVRDALRARYPSTKVRVDQTVVVVEFGNFRFEVQPVFEDDGKYLRPDSYVDKWRTVDPSSERCAFKDINERTNGTARKLAKLVRSWKQHHGVSMNGLLIDTFVQRFLFEKEDEYRINQNPGQMVLDFFTYLAKQPELDFYRAMGSNQEITVKKYFQSKAKKAAELAEAAMGKTSDRASRKAWKELFGKFVTISKGNRIDVVISGRDYSYTNTEEFIDELFPVDLIYLVEIDCTVTQDGFRPQLLRKILEKNGWLSPRKKLDFKIVKNQVPFPYEIRWKVLNKGDEAYKRDEVRGQIMKGEDHWREVTSFRGRHQVECYVIKDGVVVAQDKIDVPISPNEP